MGRNVGKDAMPTREDFLKLMWYEITKESNCKAVSNWSSCDDESGGQKDRHPSWTTSWDPRWKRA